MDLKLKNILSENFDISIRSIKNAPRQFVAKTYVIEANSGEKYFCKVIDKSLFIPSMIKSLPVLQNIHQLGFERINYPLLTKLGGLYVMHNSALVVLFNYIDAP